MSSERMKKLEASGLIGCLNETEVTSENYKDRLMGWIDVEEKYPDIEMIVAFDQETGEVFDMDLIESKWGNFFRDKKHELRDWTHWRPRTK